MRGVHAKSTTTLNPKGQKGGGGGKGNEKKNQMGPKCCGCQYACTDKGFKKKKKKKKVLLESLSHEGILYQKFQSHIKENSQKFSKTEVGLDIGM
jgi:hypothetical protein